MKKFVLPGEGDTVKVIKGVLIGAALVIVAAALAFGIFYASRIKTMSSITKVTSYDDGYDLYTMDVAYDYSLQNVIDSGITDNQTFIDAVLHESLPLLPISMKAPSFSCSAFTAQGSDGTLMGRNYDFKLDTSALLVRCSPKDGYRSIGFAALNNVAADQATSDVKARLACLTAPFICLDGVNEKGVSIAVLTLDSEPTNQQTDRQAIATTLAIRLVLDKAASTEEAVALLEGYDMFASSGRDYHFYITDASGDGRVIEYDPADTSRPLKATPMRAITNFYALYADQVLPNQKNGIYGHGKERWEAIESVLDANADDNASTAWEALRAASQDPNPNDVTSNTQWSIVYNNSDLTADITLRRHWGDVAHFEL